MPLDVPPDEPHCAVEAINLGPSTVFITSLQSYLSQILEFRHQNKNFRHFLVDVLVISVLAALCGADDFAESALFDQ